MRHHESHLLQFSNLVDTLWSKRVVPILEALLVAWPLFRCSNIITFFALLLDIPQRSKLHWMDSRVQIDLPSEASESTESNFTTLKRYLYHCIEYYSTFWRDTLIIKTTSFWNNVILLYLYNETFWGWFSSTVLMNHSFCNPFLPEIENEFIEQWVFDEESWLRLFFNGNNTIF